jgi:hypothetical protein
MKRGRILTGLTVLVLAAGLTVPATQSGAAGDMDILEKVRSAKTPADHEAIAEYYDEQAAAAKKSADLHRKMADSYKAGGTSIGKGGGPVPLPQHCQQLAKMYDQEAAHYQAMADTHRELAKHVK